MPIFEFACKECQHQFNLLISNADKDKVRCPVCDSVNVKQLLSLFSTGRSKAAGNNSNCNDCAARTKG